MPKKKNHGKDFEIQIRDAFKRVPNTFVCRLKDSQSMYRGDENPCDFVFYRNPKLYLIECKTTYGHTLNWSNIRDNQWNSLLSVCDVPGIVAGYMIWFISDDLTIYISSKELLKHREMGFKSLSATKDLDSLKHVVIDGKKRRVLFDYDVESFMNLMEEEI